MNKNEIKISKYKIEKAYFHFKKIKILLIIFIFINNELNSEGINTVFCFDEVIQKINSAPLETLVLMDIDNVILAYKDLILRPCGETLRKNLQKKLDEVCGQEEVYTPKKNILLSEYLKGKIIEKTMKTSTYLLDKDISKVFENIHKKNLKVMGITAGRIRDFAWFEDMATCRLEQLKKVGVYFKSSFSDIHPFFLENILTPEGSHPLFREGVLFTAKSSKGDALGVFLERIDLTPKEVIMVDDRREKLEDVQIHMKKKGIKFYGFHLQHHHFNHEIINEELARFQFDYLRKNHEWLNDEEAINLLENKK